MTDARFEDAGEDPLRLKAETAEDLPVLAALVQDAVAQTSEMSWARKKRRFMLLINRFRWEDREMAEKMKRSYERVQSLLVIEDVVAIRAQGVDPKDKDLVLNLLSLTFEPGEDGAGDLILTFSGDGALALSVETLDVALKDVSRPYQARASVAPEHPVD